MKILSSPRICEAILTILSIVLLSNLLAEAQDLQNFQHFPKRASFPSDFLFGAGTSAMQIEGAANEGGRGPSIWDDRVKRNPGAFIDSDKFPTLIQHYRRYKEDVKHLKNLRINSYRMSISWSRVLPDGTIKGGINQEGVDFYNHLIDDLLANGIKPFVTILHFDHPLAIEQNFGGFLNRSIVNYYKDYCELLFKTYGDRVKHWTTINEAEVTGLFTYMHGYDNDNPEPCQTTKLCTQAYIVVHNYILCHATAVKLYREKFQATQRGEIGLVLSSQSYVPYSSKLEDVVAAERLMDFSMGWVLDPLIYGDYPKIMRELVWNRLPNFTKEEKKFVKGSIDFIGINYYTSHFAKHEPNRTNMKYSDNYDALATIEVYNAKGETIGYLDKHSGSYVYPEGLYNVLQHIKKKYQNPNIYITENGIASMNLTDPLADKHRIKYIASHLNYTKVAIENGVKVRGYFAWAAFDTFEFEDGYSKNWGLIHVNFKDYLKRQPTVTGRWYKRFLTHV
ncbi:hypothetical protein VNO77_19681 [Canavalia gladiata]|uniref:Beta-glucosidase n=1 Tax=Canavalia gladiata TaxID=3824 RepID=A0AAN9LRD4_CANGL